MNINIISKRKKKRVDKSCIQKIVKKFSMFDELELEIDRFKTVLKSRLEAIPKRIWKHVIQQLVVGVLCS